LFVSDFDAAEASGMKDSAVRPSRFISLKWKAFVLTSLLLTVIIGFFCWLNHSALMDQFEKRRSLVADMQENTAQELMLDSFEELERLTGTVPYLSEMADALNSGNPSAIKVSFDKHWPILQIDYGVELVNFYSADGETLGSWGNINLKNFNQDIRQLAGEAVLLEQPASIFYCADKCLNFSAVPLLVEGNIAGTALMAASMVDVILDLKQASGAETALIVTGDNQSTEQKGQKDRVVPEWRARIAAATNAPKTVEILKALARECSLEQAKDGFFLQKGNAVYELQAISLHDFESRGNGKAFLAVITDISDEIRVISSTGKMNLGLGILGLALSEAVLLFILWAPMSRLMEATQKLPLLAEGEFEKVRNSLAKRKSHRIGNEVDVLADAAAHLSVKLEELTGQVEERSRSLEVRMEELARERDFVKRLLDTAQLAIFTHDVGGSVRTANRYAQLLTGYSSFELVGKSFLDLTEQDPCILALTEEKQKNQAVSGHQYQCESKIRSKDGSTRDVAWFHTLVPGREAGSEKLILSVGLDLTDRKKLEEQLRQSQKMEAIGVLAGGIAHDFNNILSAIFGYAELAKLGLPEGTEQQSNLEQVLSAANRARELVRQILTFGRKCPEKREPVSIRQVVEEAMALISASIPKTIEIRQNLSEKSGIVLADPTQLHQVIMNLCTNAYQAMGKKSESVLEVSLYPLEAGVLDAFVDLDDLRKKQYAVLVVKDTGPGMNKATSARIFEPYFTTKKPGEGTGLGLAVVHGIVESHGGRIKVESAPGKGTTFYIYLPRCSKEKNNYEHKETSFSGGNERVLFIDDEPALAVLGGKLLTALGYEATTTTSSEEALRLFTEKPLGFDLIVTDQTMKGMTGDVLAGKLLEIRRDIPIILCTGYSELVDERRAMEIGIAQFLMKPIVMGELSEAVRKALDGSWRGPVD